MNIIKYSPISLLLNATLVLMVDTSEFNKKGIGYVSV